jgi:cytochrome c-type biogenesis protein CcmF
MALGLEFWASGLCFSLCAFSAGTIAQEYWRGANVRRKNSGTDFFTALVGLVGRNKRRYGGYIVHLGIVLMFLGFAGSAYKLDEQVLLKQGQEVTVGKYTIRNDGIKVHDDGQKQMTTAYLAIFRGGKQIDTMYPARWFFRRHENEPTTEVAIRRSFGEDLYVVLPTVDPASAAAQTATLQIVVNPLVNWIWLGFGVIAFGTGIALLPERTYSFAVARMPDAQAATTAVALLLVVLLSAVPLSAQQHEDNPALIGVPRNDLERQLRDEMGCICGTCAHEALSKCTCGYASQMRAQLRGQIDAGKSKDQILAHFVSLYGGQHFLSSPPNQGFSRLAWLLPFTVGAGAAVAVGLVAMRWSRKDRADRYDPSAPTDPELDDRLDDELRNLD